MEYYAGLFYWVIRPGVRVWTFLVFFRCFSVVLGVFSIFFECFWCFWYFMCLCLCVLFFYFRPSPYRVTLDCFDPCRPFVGLKMLMYNLFVHRLLIGVLCLWLSIEFLTSSMGSLKKTKINWIYVVSFKCMYSWKAVFMSVFMSLLDVCIVNVLSPPKNNLVWRCSRFFLLISRFFCFSFFCSKFSV